MHVEMITVVATQILIFTALPQDMVFYNCSYELAYFHIIFILLSHF